MDDISKISESEFKDGLNPLERDEELLKKFNKIAGEGSENSRRLTNEAFQKGVKETMPQLDKDIIVRIESCSPVHFEVLLKKKRALNRMC